MVMMFYIYMNSCLFRIRHIMISVSSGPESRFVVCAVVSLSHPISTRYIDEGDLTVMNTTNQISQYVLIHVLLLYLSYPLNYLS